MALVIAHAELVSDQTSDPRTAPQRRREAVRLGAFQQQRLEAFELRGVQQRLTAGAAGLAQPGFAVTPVSSQPLADALPRDLQSPRCLGLTTALLDQPDRFETALLQGLEIPPYAFCISHTYKDVRTPKRCHFILRDSIVLLDEPFSGLDVSSALVLRSLIEELAARGKVVLFSSHELETVERLCSRVVILHRGKIVANDSVEVLRELMALPTLEDIFSQLAVEQDTAAISRQIADLIEA